MKRMLDDYIERFYRKLAARSALLMQNDYAEARNIAAWKKEVAEHWDDFEIKSFEYGEDAAHPAVGDEYIVRIVIDRKNLKSMLGVEIVYTRENPEDHTIEFVSATPFQLKKVDGTKLYFELKKKTKVYGHLRVCFRVYLVNEQLPHRICVDFG